jgi:hypothetical protein
MVQEIMKLRYVEIPTEKIFNWLDPFNITAKWACKAITGDWWSEENVAIRRFFADTWTKELDKITGHFTDLEESIKEKGILTPLSIDSGGPRGSYLKPFHFPPEMQNDLANALHTVNFGGSRLTIAQKLGIETVPCAVHDYANMFPNEPVITQKNFQKWFGKDYFFSPSPPCLRIKHMMHIKNPKYRALHTKTKKAQQDAAKIAQRITYEKFGLK